MRVLIVIAGMICGACYDPSVRDCQFACGANKACPSGTQCMAGFCRDTMTGTCMSSSDGDAGIICPSTSPCGATPIALSDGECAALCSQSVTFASATTTCGDDTGATATWHIAILDSAARRTAFGDGLAATVAWIGLEQTATLWHWLNAANETQATTSPPWESGEPNPTNLYGLFDSTGGLDEFRTSGATETWPFICAYEP